MGYRSDVRIRLRKEDYDKLLKDYKKCLDKLSKQVGYVKYDLFNELAVYKEQDIEKHTYEPVPSKTGKCVYFGWNDVKWYENCDGYEDIDFIMHFIDKLHYWAYLRIGEDIEDIDVIGHSFYSIDFRTIIIDDEEDNND